MTVYLDHAATTPMLPEAIAAYTSALGIVGNSSSIHSQGQNAKRMLEEARERVAASLGADAIEIVFTSGGTESVNLGVKGIFWARNGVRSDRPRPRILVPRGEHHATIDAVEWLERHEGAVIEWIPLDSVGRVSVAHLTAALGPDVALVTMLSVNNEVGTIQPVDEVVAAATAQGVPVHVDAIAGWGHVPIDFATSGLAALSVSAHKIGGPLGIGALVLSRTADVVPLIHGGGQQRQVRSGTQDVPAAIAFGTAASSTAASSTAASSTAGSSTAASVPHPSIAPLRDRLIAGVRAAVPTAVLRGDPVARIDSNAHFTFPGCEGDSLLFLLDQAGISVSTGSACQAGIPEPSHVLLAMGLTEDEARGALRVTLGHTTTDADVDTFLAALPGAVARARRAGYADRVVAR